MTKSNVMSPLARANAFVLIAVLAVGAAAPILLNSSKAGAAQLTNRFIDLSSYNSSGGDSSEGSGRDGADAFGDDVTYTVGFRVDNAGAPNIGGLVIDFCGDSPITGDPCNVTEDLDGTYGFNLDAANLAIASQNGITDFTVDTTNSTATKLVLTRTAASVAANTSVKFDLGTTADNDGITNPNDQISFYARIFTFAATADAQTYTSAVPGAFTDDGGIAMAVSNELTISARVQEVLEFCVGTDTASALTDDSTTDDCSLVAGTDISLGVVDSASTSTSTLEGNSGIALIRTNASNGAVIYYKAEQNTASGQLKINGSTCGVLGSLADQCFNSRGVTKTAIAVGVENFGMSLRDLSRLSGGATTNLGCETEYNGDGTGCTGAPTGYAWDDSGAFTPIASSASVLDDERVGIEFAATASPTTPTGLYTVTANFVATATF